MKAIRITPQPDEARVEVIDLDGKLPSLQTEVGGYVELVRFSDDVHAYINEEGKIQGLQVNLFASLLSQSMEIGLRRSDMLVGTVILLGSLNEQGEYDAEDHDIPQRWIDALQKFDPAVLHPFCELIKKENTAPA